MGAAARRSGAGPSLRRRGAPEPAAQAAPRPLSPPRIFAYVDAVARHGSIRKAAAALHIVSSALNRRILDLEGEMGAPLFERLPRGVRPTAAGELYLAYVRRSIRELEQVGAQIEGLRRLLRGRVRLAVAESVTGYMLPTAIARFQTQHPNVTFHVRIDGPKGIAEALASDDADLILTHDPLERPQISVIASAHQPFCALVAPDHPLAGRTSLRLRDCVAYPIAMPDNDARGARLSSIAPSCQRVVQARAGAGVELRRADEDVRATEPGRLLPVPHRRQERPLGHARDSASPTQGSRRRRSSWRAAAIGFCPSRPQRSPRCLKRSFETL